MPTVTSENREEFNAKEMARKAGNPNEIKMRDPASYKSFAKEAEDYSEKADTHMGHWKAMGSHKHAAMYAEPHPVAEEHKEKAEYHAKQARILKKLENERYISANEANRRKENQVFMKKGDEKRRKAGTL